ncbi:hypothetical protein K502DRAFT_346570 [Neoconidiobolus thromboides FSU 785]|nr:hypothetical protein K502DRAFT_346570 [Neoconidiobolus thromboides FSU 785]
MLFKKKPSNKSTTDPSTRNLKYRLVPRFFWARLMLYLCLLQTICMICLVIYLEIKPSSELTYRLIFLVAQVFSLIICWDAVTHKNVIQAISFIIFNGFCLSFVVIQHQNIRPPYKGKEVLLAIIIAEACCTISYIALTWEIYREYGWKIYKKLGADEAIHKMYKHYQILIVLMEMELFLSLAVAVQLGTNDHFVNNEIYVQLAFVIPISVIILGIAFYALTKENKVIMLLVIIIHFLTLAYFIYRIYRVTSVFSSTEISENPYINTGYYLTFSLSVTIVINILTLIYLIKCYLDFGKGLSEQILRHRLKNRSLENGVDQELEDGDVLSIPRFQLD